MLRTQQSDRQHLTRPDLWVIFIPLHTSSIRVSSSRCQGSDGHSTAPSHHHHLQLSLVYLSAPIYYVNERPIILFWLSIFTPATLSMRDMWLRVCVCVCLRRIILLDHLLCQSQDPPVVSFRPVLFKHRHGWLFFVSVVKRLQKLLLPMTCLLITGRSIYVLRPWRCFKITYLSDCWWINVEGCHFCSTGLNLCGAVCSSYFIQTHHNQFNRSGD